MYTKAFSILLVAVIFLFLTGCSDGSGGVNGFIPGGTTVGGGTGTGTGTGSANPPATNTPLWQQWGANAQHSGQVAVAGQSAAHQLADIVYDPFVTAEQTESAGELLAHYQAPLTDGNDVYIMVKTGSYTACNPAGNWINGALCGPNAWSTQIWNEARYTWVGTTLTRQWIFASDWKPPVNGSSLAGWEPVFHPVNANSFIYVPTSAGTVTKVDKNTGGASKKINPFSGVSIVPGDTYVAGPLTADSNGNIYYNVIQLAPSGLGDPWSNSDIINAWLVKITSGDVTSLVSYSTLVSGAPAAGLSVCPGRFTTANASLPWPPSPTTVPAATLCGSQRPGVNVAPAVASDGTIYTVSRAHFNPRTTYMVAVNPDLTVKWVASMQNRLNDGCGVLVPIAPGTNPNQANSCRTGSNPGVDPTTNAAGSGSIVDQSSSSPTVMPDGSIVYGAMTNYNGGRGHLLKFSSSGTYQGAYDFGWDTTPAVVPHSTGYSIVIKDNHYPAGLYCSGSNPICAAQPAGPFYITQLSSTLVPEWQFQSTNTQSCHRNSDGTVTCVNDHPNGFEWCINAPAVDNAGLVYANNEDGKMYVIPQGHTGVFNTPLSQIFLNQAIGAAYTPLTLDAAGRLYTQNGGHLFAVGN